MGSLLNKHRERIYGPAQSIGEQELVRFELGELGGLVTGPLERTRVALHHEACEPFVELVRAWTEADLWRHVLTFDRSYDPALRPSGIPGAHAWGNAFDLNTQWNPLGSRGAKRGTEGSTHELEEIARKLGWTCGRDFPVGRAARHFEWLQGAGGSITASTVVPVSRIGLLRM